ncbi:MAG: Ig-like domain-containing protein, partial [Bacteroidetes bacterium]|nr:Ig-like domain-containing protein [Bacteroidota bacterium]
MKKSLLKILSIRNRDYSQYFRSLLLTDSVHFSLRAIVIACLLLNFMNIVQAQTIGVRIPNVSVLVGDTIDVPVYIDSSLTGANVFSYQFQISYNTNVVDPIDVVPGSVNGSFGNPLYGFTSSYVNVANAGTIPLADTGVLFYITFVGKQASYTALNFNGTGNNFLNEGSPSVDLDNGSITVQAQTILNISPTNPIILNGNQQQFSASSGTPPYSWLSDNPSVATIDNVTGLATGISIGTTEISATDVNGAVGSTLLEVRGFKLTIRDTSGLTGTTLDLPIYVSDLSGLNVTSGNFTLSYTSSRISFNSIITTGTMLDGYSLPEANQSTNSLNIAFAGSTPLVGSGILMYIRFDLSTVSTGGSSINFQNVVFNEDLLAIV